MWRNGCVSDTYEPGSTFKIITSTAALEAGAVSLNDTFYCPGFKIVEDRRIRCHKAGGHGSETFVQGVQNSCNPVFMEVGARLGVGGMFRGMRQLGILSKPISTFRERHQRSCISKKCGSGGTCYDVFWTVVSVIADQTVNIG